MKKLKFLILIFSSVLLFSSESCKKSKTDENTSCKTCKAFKTADKPEATSQVCTDAAEQAFRSQHSGQEISCQ